MEETPEYIHTFALGWRSLFQPTSQYGLKDLHPLGILQDSAPLQSIKLIPVSN